MVFLVDTVSFIANNLTAFLFVESFIEEYMLISSPDAFFTLSIFKYNSSSLYFRLDAWTMETRE